MACYNSDSFYPLIEQFSFCLGDDITIPFIIESNSNVISFEYESIGFSVVEEPYLSCKKAFITIKNDNLQLYPTINIKANLANGKQLSSKIYGVVEDGYLYINANSYEAAKDIYLSEKLSNNSITKKDYELIMMQNNNCFEINNSLAESSFEPTRSSTGGWVVGTLRWQDDWGNWHPLQHTKISIYDEDPISDDNMGTVYTDEDGDYIFSFDDNIDDLFDNSGRDIYIKVWPAGINSIVKTGSNNEYVIRTTTYWDVTTGSITPINIDVYMNSDLGRAFQVSQAIITGANYASVMNGTTMANVTVRYPHNESSNGCFYKNLNDTVYIVGNRVDDTKVISGQILHSYASWDVIMHEYGHFVQDKLNIEDNPGGTHWSTVNMYDHYMSHHNGGPVTPDCDGDCANPSASNAKDRAIKIAYAEAWPSILGAMAQQYYINLGELDNNIVTVGDDQYVSYNGATSDYNNGSRTGEAVESAVMGVLWDIYDNDTESYDNITLGHANWWNLTVGNSPKTFSAVVGRFYSLYSSYAMWDPFDKLLEYYKMSPDDINISGTIMSYLTPTITWTPNGTSSSLLNNSFRVMIYNSSYSLVVDYYTTNTSTTLSQEQWNSVLSSGGDKFYITIGGSQTNGTSTGYYYSALKEFSKPVVQTVLESGTIKIIGYYDWTPSNLTIQSSYNGFPTTTIGESAFYDFDDLTNVNLPSSITSIEASAFENCSYLTSINIPNSVLSIGNKAFKSCLRLSSVIINRAQLSLTTLGSNAFSGCSSSLQITVPIDRIAEYKNKLGWSTYSSKIQPNSNNYTTITLNSSSNINQYVDLDAGFNKLYKLSVNYQAYYRFTASSTASNIFKLKLYNSSMSLLTTSSGVITEVLNSSYYYLSVEFNSSSISGEIQTNFLKYSDHTHSYGAPYVWYDYTQHNETCSCGATHLQGHAVSPGSLGPGQQYTTCLICGGPASMGIMPLSNNNLPCTINGSYILPNGVIVLADDDIDDYLDGTLVFINPGEYINRSNSIPFILKREDEYLLD